MENNFGSSSLEKISDIDHTELLITLKNEIKCLKEKNLNQENIQDKITESLIKRAEKIYNLCVKVENRNYDNADRKTFLHHIK